MGTEFLFSVIATVSSLLSSLRSSGATSPGGAAGNAVENDLTRLGRLLKRIQAVLRDAGEREIREEHVKLYLKELNAVACEAEDILDKCQYELLRRQVEESGESSSSSADCSKRKRLHGIISDDIAERIKSVIEQFEEISNDRSALSLRGDDDGARRVSGWTGLLATSHMVNESVIFGRDHDKQRIVDFVLSDSRGRNGSTISAIGVVGMGGLGKTTLAQLVYNDSLVQSRFRTRAWVYISPEFDVTRITKEILQSIDPREAYGNLTSLSAAQQALIEAVRGKEVLVVLDDVWNESPQGSHERRLSPSNWEELIKPLRAAELVKIVMTTRNEVVAEIIGTEYTHNLSCLSEDQSVSLFEHCVFGDQFIDESTCLQKIGVEIVRKCAGLPLAIKSIARVLSYKMDEDSWRYILESELWESDDHNDIFPALKVSYYSLPLELKPCFLFCCSYPKGTILPRNQIIYMWIAQDYVQPRGSTRAEDLGNKFIHELHRRSFLTKVNALEGNGLEFFVMHDLIHDLGTSISMGAGADDKCEVPPSCAQDLDGLRRQCSLTRTLILCKHIISSIDHSCMSVLMGLRVLLWGVSHPPDLEHLIRLKHLRYLVICQACLHESSKPSEKLERLPASITVLYNLVALQLWFLEHLIELPVQIGKLVNLRFLSIECVGIRELPESLCNLTNLQCLYVLSCEHIEKLPASFGNLTSLRELYISELNIRELPASFCKLQNLQTLSVERCWRMTKIPDCIGDLSNLQWIYWEESCIETLPESMNSLSKLKILKLGCKCSPVSLLCRLEGLLNRSSLNFSIYNHNIKWKPKIPTENINWHLKNSPNFWIFSRYIRGAPKIPVTTISGTPENRNSKCRFGELDICKYLKTSRITESVQSFIEMAELEVKENQRVESPLNAPIKLEINGYQGVGYASRLSDVYSPVVAIAVHCHVKSVNFFTELGDIPSLQSLSLVALPSIQNLWLNAPRSVTRHNTKVNFPYLKELELIDMLEWTGSIGEQDCHFPALEYLKIENCPKLASIPNFSNLRKLEIIRCSFTKLELNLFRSLLLETLLIEECIQLTLLKGLQSLDSLQALCVCRCPLLTGLMFQKNPNSLLSVEIVECPFLKDWCRIQQFKYIENSMLTERCGPAPEEMIT